MLTRYPIALEGYDYWYQSYPFQDFDEYAKQFLPLESNLNEWLKNTRRALFFSTNQLAKTLKISRQAYAKFEVSEKRGSISLKSLRRLAEAMDCELVYAIRPKSQKRYSQVVWDQLVSECKDHSWVKSRPVVAKERALAAVSRIKMAESAFRKKRKWTERRN